MTRAQLDVFPDPQAAHDRRGSHWTFDGAGYIEFLRQLRDTTNPSTILTAPSFDHALKDPTPDAVTIHPYHRLVIIEGLYTFLAIHPWSDGGFLLDERWFVEIDPAEGRRRLIDRHLLTGVAKDLTEAEWRADANDVPSTSAVHQLILLILIDRSFRFVQTGYLSSPTCWNLHELFTVKICLIYRDLVWKMSKRQPYERPAILELSKWKHYYFLPSFLLQHKVTADIHNRSKLENITITHKVLSVMFLFHRSLSLGQESSRNGTHLRGRAFAGVRPDVRPDIFTYSLVCLVLKLIFFC